MRNRQWMLWVTGVALFTSTAALAVPPSVMVAGFSTKSHEEYRWIGNALSESLTQRLLDSGKARVISIGQWESVLRERDLPTTTLNNEEDALLLAKTLGATEVVLGNFVAAWPEIQIRARRFALGQEQPVAKAEVTGRLEELPKLEAKLAQQLFAGPLAAAGRKLAAPPKVDTWRAMSLCRDSLALQSLGPDARPWLPKGLAQQALSHCEAALQANPRDAESRAFAGLAHLLLGEAKRARAEVQRALRARKIPGWSDLVAYFVFRQLDDPKAADRALEAAVRRRPGFLHARTLRAASLIRDNQPEQARTVLEGILAETGVNPWVMAQLGKAIAKQGDIELALSTTDQALKLIPKDPVLLLEKASRHIDGKQWEAAEATLREAMALDPRLAAAYLRLGYVYLETGQLDLAGPILEKALVEADLESERRIRGYAHYDLAKLAGKQGDVPRALAALQKALAAGFGDRARFAADPDLAAASQAPEFNTLFKE